MNEEIEYAEMLEIPVSTVNVVRKTRRRKKADTPAPSLKDTVIDTVNDRVLSADSNLFAEAANSEGNLDFDTPERIDTVRLYSTDGETDTLFPFETELNEGGRVEMNDKSSKKIRLALGIELGVTCALCAGIFLTNVFIPNSAVNTFFRALNTPAEKIVAKPYTDFTLTPVVSELSDAKLTLSENGVLSFTDECCVYPAADGKVSAVTKTVDGLYTLTISHSDTFTGVISGLNTVYYQVGDEVKSNVPVGFSEGESEVQVTMYSETTPLNCFELTEENCLAWISTAE